MARSFVEGMLLGLLAFVAFSVYYVAWQGEDIVTRAYVYQMVQPNQVSP